METFVKSSVLNSLWSIWYCLVVVSFQIYITYREISRYLVLRQAQWRTSILPPPELTAQLVLVIVSILCVPLFILACIFRTGNYANDGVKLGRDHAFNSNIETVFRPVHFTTIRRLWRHFCPLAQTLHLMAALCLLLPDTLITAAGVHETHRGKESIWTTELDVLFHPRKIYSGITRPISSNLSAVTNITHFVGSHILILPEHPVSLNFFYFTSAFLAFSTRYSAIFWYTNKILSCIFALQLFWMTIHSLFTFCGMSILYKLSFNHWAYPEIPLFLPSIAVIGLYIAGGFCLIISTVTIFEYGLHFFEEKFRLVLQRHHPAFGKDYFPISPTTCQGYIPHSCAMLSLIFLALCKGPLIYELVNTYRFTQSRFILICVIIDVTYMVLWVALWSVLTLKQTWRFRILDYVSAGHPVFMVPSDHIVRNPSFDQIELAELHRRKKRRHHGSVPSMSTNSDCCDTDTVGTIEEETISQLPPIAEHPRDEQECNLPNGVLVRKVNYKVPRKAGMVRVTFDETANRASEEDEPQKLDLCQDLYERQEINSELYVPGSIDSVQHLGIDNPCLSVSSVTSSPRDSQNISAEVHSPSSEWDTIPRGEQDMIIMNNNTTMVENVEPNAPPESRESTLSRDYKADLRNRCDIYFNRDSMSLKQENLYVVREEDGGGGPGGGTLNGTLQNSSHPEHGVVINNQRASTLPSKRGGSGSSPPPNTTTNTTTNNNNDLLRNKLNGSVVQPTDNSAASLRRSEKISLLEKDKKNFSTFKHSYPSERLKLSSTSLASDTPIPNGHLNRPDIVPNDPTNNSSEILEQNINEVK